MVGQLGPLFIRLFREKFNGQCCVSRLEGLISSLSLSLSCFAQVTDSRDCTAVVQVIRARLTRCPRRCQYLNASLTRAKQQQRIIKHGSLGYRQSSFLHQNSTRRPGSSLSNRPSLHRIPEVEDRAPGLPPIIQMSSTNNCINSRLQGKSCANVSLL